jgi:hypothetical protein
MCKEAVVFYFKVTSQNLFRRTGETTKPPATTAGLLAEIQTWSKNANDAATHDKRQDGVNSE